MTLLTSKNAIIYGGGGSLGAAIAEVSWLQPYPDQLLDEVAARGDRPAG